MASLGSGSVPVLGRFPVVLSPPSLCAKASENPQKKWNFPDLPFLRRISSAKRKTNVQGETDLGAGPQEYHPPHTEVTLFAKERTPMKLLIVWNLLLTAGLAYSVVLLHQEDPTAHILRKLSATWSGDQINHGRVLPGSGAVDSRVSGAGTLVTMRYLPPTADPETDSPYGITHSVNKLGSSISLAYATPDGTGDPNGSAISIRLKAYAPDADTSTDGAALYLSGVNGRRIELGFSNDDRPFLRATAGDRKRTWWLVEGESEP